MHRGVAEIPEAPCGASPAGEERAEARGDARLVSVLFPAGPGPLPEEVRQAPDSFRDLGLDQVVAAVTAGRDEYDLAPFFFAPLPSLDAVTWRQEVMQELDEPAARRAVGTFAERMRTVRGHLETARKSSYDLERQRWHLAAAELYADAAEGLERELSALDLSSRGLLAFRTELASLVRGEPFATLAAECRSTAAALAAVRFCVLIRDGTVTVSPYEGQGDFSVAVAETFGKFRKADGKSYLHTFRDGWGMNHVEAQIMERAALLHPDAFGALARFSSEHAAFVDPLLARFDREVQFYAAWLDYADRFRRAGLSFCIPRVSCEKEVSAREAFDLALAGRLVREGRPVVCNDFFLRGAERVLVVTGPNQGGKTTFARTFGQLHHLASLGCPVPGREARLFLPDGVFAHFGREDDLATLRGTLEDDLTRIHEILRRATSRSVFVVNEIFSSTTAEDALFLGREVLERILRLDALGVCVTFLDELASLGEGTVSMVAGVDPNDPAARTFRVERRPPDGLAYALAIAEKHRVTRRWLEERIRP